MAAPGFVFFEVAVVKFWVGGVEGWLCCIGDLFAECQSLVFFCIDGNGREEATSLIDQFAGLHDVLLEGKAQGVGHLRFRTWRCSCSGKLDTSGSNAEENLRWLHDPFVMLFKKQR